VIPLIKFMIQHMYTVCWVIWGEERRCLWYAAVLLSVGILNIQWNVRFPFVERRDKDELCCVCPLLSRLGVSEAQCGRRSAQQNADFTRVGQRESVHIPGWGARRRAITAIPYVTLKVEYLKAFLS